MTTISDVQAVGKEIDKIVKQLTQVEKSVKNSVKSAKTLTTGSSGGNPSASFGGLSDQTKQVLGKYSAMGGMGGSGLMATSLGVISTGVASLWNSVPGVDDMYTYKQQIFDTAFTGNGQFNADKQFGKIKAGFGPSWDGTAVNAANMMTNAGISTNSTRFGQTTRDAGMMSRFSGRSNFDTAAGQVAMQQGSQGVVGNLASVGIFVTDPTTGKSGGLRALVDQLWLRWYGSSTARVDSVQFDADLMGGWVGSDMQQLFGGSPELYKNVLDALRMKVKAGGASVNLNPNKNGKNSANALMGKSGIKTEDTPWWARQSAEQGRAENIADSSNALAKGFQDAVAAINLFNKGMNNFINSEAGQMFFRAKAFTDTALGSQELGGIGNLVGAAATAAAGRLLTGGRPFSRGPKTPATPNTPIGTAKPGGVPGGRLPGASSAIKGTVWATLAALVGSQFMPEGAAKDLVFGPSVGSSTQMPDGTTMTSTGEGTWSRSSPELDALLGGGSQTSVIPGGAGDGPSAGSESSSATGSAVAALAEGVIGAKYVAGGRSEAGWDCAGMTYALYKRLGVILPQVSWEQIKKGSAVSDLSQAKPGDLVFFHVYKGHTRDPGPLKVNHVGVYVGKGQMVHASSPRSGTIKGPVKNSWSKLVGIRRYLDVGKLNESQQGVLNETLKISGSGDQVGASGALSGADAMSAGLSLGGIMSASSGGASVVSEDNTGNSSPNTNTSASGAADTASSVPSSGIGASSVLGLDFSKKPAGAWKGSPLGDKDLISVLQAAGFKGDDLREAYAISMRESGGDPTAFNGGPRDYSYGLFQINFRPVGGLDPAKRDASFRKYVDGYNGPNSLFDPNVNARAAAYMSQKGKAWESGWGGVTGRAEEYYANYPGASAGMYLSRDQTVNAHAGEMIVPAYQTTQLKELLQGGIDKWKKPANITIHVNVKNASREEAERFAKWIKQDLQKESVIDRMRSK